MTANWMRVLWVVGLSWPWPHVGAQEMLRDPMRPALRLAPVRQLSAPNGESPAQGGALETSDERVQDTGPELPDRVQMLITGKGGNSAVIDGTVVGAGDVFRLWRVIQVSDEGVLLRYGTQLHRIPVTPQVRKLAPTRALSR